MLSPNLKSQRVQGTKREDENLPGIDCHNNPGLVVKLTVSHGQQLPGKERGKLCRLNKLLPWNAEDYCLWISVRCGHFLDHSHFSHTPAPNLPLAAHSSGR
jgi:hypothetical protein